MCESVPMRITYETGLGLFSNEVAPGLFMGLPGVATFEDAELEGALYDVKMTLDMTAEGIRPTSVTVTAQQDSPAVTGTTLRALRVWDLAREAILIGVSRGTRTDTKDGSFEVGIMGSALPNEEVARLRAQGPTDETLGWVAYFYKLGDVLGLPPAKQVEVSLQLPRTTASKWVRRAREKGLIADGKH